MKQDALGDGQLFIHLFTLLYLIITALVHTFTLVKVALKRYLVHLFAHILEKGHFSRLFLGFLQPKVCGLFLLVDRVLTIDYLFVLLVHLFNTFLFDRLLDNVIKNFLLLLGLFLFVVIRRGLLVECVLVLSEEERLLIFLDVLKDVVLWD